MFESKRLYLKELSAPHLHRLHSGPDVMEFIGKLQTLEETKATLTRCLEYNRTHSGHGFWACYEKKTHKFIGWLALKHFSNTEEIEVGWRLLKEFWGKGYATEMAKVLLNYGFNKLKLDKIMSVTLVDNIRSQRVMEKLGMKYIKNIIHAGLDHKYYSINK